MNANTNLANDKIQDFAQELRSCHRADLVTYTTPALKYVKYNYEMEATLT